jgi:hypothetical protein
MKLDDCPDVLVLVLVLVVAASAAAALTFDQPPGDPLELFPSLDEQASGRDPHGDPLARVPGPDVHCEVESAKATRRRTNREKPAPVLERRAQVQCGKNSESLQHGAGDRLHVYSRPG